MATAPTPPPPPKPPAPNPAPAPAAPQTGATLPEEKSTRDKPVEYMRLVGHSSLFYWWPVWVFGFLFALWTMAENTRMAHVPPHTDIKPSEKADESYKMVPDPNWTHGAKAFNDKVKDEIDRAKDPEGNLKTPRVSHHAWMGTLYCIILLLVVVITNVPLRGLWSVIVVITVALLGVLFYSLHWLGPIAAAVGHLHIYIGFAGYLFIATVLCLLWCISTFLFDRQVYITFTPGQMRVCEQVGAGENVYDTAGMQIEKLRTDWFRHIVLGMAWMGGGTGDVTVKTSGAQAHTVELKNVWRINPRLKLIEAMQRERQTVQV